MSKYTQSHHRCQHQSENRGCGHEGDEESTIPDKIDLANLQKYQYLESTCQNIIVFGSVAFTFVHSYG